MKWKQRLTDSHTIISVVVIVLFLVAWQLLLSLPLRSNPQILFEDSFEKVNPVWRLTSNRPELTSVELIPRGGFSGGCLKISNRDYNRSNLEAYFDASADGPRLLTVTARIKAVNLQLQSITKDHKLFGSVYVQEYPVPVSELPSKEVLFTTWADYQPDGNTDWLIATIRVNLHRETRSLMLGLNPALWAKSRGILLVDELKVVAEDARGTFIPPTFMQRIKTGLSVLILYFGLGWALAGCFARPWRNSVLLWFALSLWLTPLFLAVGAPLTSDWPGQLLLLIVLAGIFRGLVPKYITRLIRFPRLVMKPTAKNGWMVALLIAVAYLTFLADSKYPLLTDQHMEISDDNKHTSVVVSVAATGTHPRFYNDPGADLQYYFYAYLLPGLCIRASDGTGSVASAWGFHALIQAGVFFACLLFWGRRLFRTDIALIALLMAFTFFGGGTEWISLAEMKMQGQSPDKWMMWGTQAFNRPLFFASPWSYYLWSTQHVSASIAFLGIVLLQFCAGDYRLRALLQGLLVAAIFGLSSLILLPVLIVIGLCFIREIFSKPLSRILLKYALMGFTAAVFALPLFLILQGGESGNFIHYEILQLKFLTEDVQGTIWGQFLQAVTGLIPVILADFGILGLSAIWACWGIGKKPRSFQQDFRWMIVGPFVSMILISWFFFTNRTNNDVAMRAVFPFLFVLPFGFAVAVEKLHLGNWKCKVAAWGVLLLVVVFHFPGNMFLFPGGDLPRCQAPTNPENSRFELIAKHVGMRDVVWDTGEYNIRAVMQVERVVFFPFGKTRGEHLKFIDPKEASTTKADITLKEFASYDFPGIRSRFVVTRDKKILADAKQMGADFFTDKSGWTLVKLPDAAES